MARPKKGFTTMSTKRKVYQVVVQLKADSNEFVEFLDAMIAKGITIIKSEQVPK
jgi:hypothetical protein